ncbi:MAG: tRNA (adenosine(37)-N6)-dimethylallyltransferase MiaA [Holophaga sp.]|nr:tRNA (adenosine(37)-N6)-dimethylallyltransferase MiaA [Holophaga sp.]
MTTAASTHHCAILGPTASGKSRLAVEVARRLGGRVVNGDPFQAFHGITIGTGQPDDSERGDVPHIGYGVLPLSESVNPSRFGFQVREWLSVDSVLVTGSGLYLRGIWDQLSELPDVPEGLVKRVRRWATTLSSPGLHRYLCAVDPVRGSQLHPNDQSRIQRALALHLATGRRPSALVEGIQHGVPAGWKALIVLPSRERLRARVAQRVRGMIAAGWAQEVHDVVAAGHEADLRRLRPLGYEAWLEGGDSQVIEAQIIQSTQAYAKRQTTFFRNQWPEIPVWDPDFESVETAFARLGF